MSRHSLRLRLTIGLGLAATLACGGSSPPANAPPPASAPNSATTPAVPSPPLPLDPKVTAGSLPNGLSYFLQRQKPDDKRAYLVLVVKAGSVFEEDDQRGLAHFVEHMAFAGTQRFEKQALLDFFEKSGLVFGAHLNAFTSYDRTQYLLNVPTDDPLLLARALDVMADWSHAVTFDAVQLEKERQIMLSEWTSSRGGMRRLGEQHRQILLAGSRFAEREVIGDQKVLKEAPRQRIVDFYRRWYRPDRMAVVVVGDIDPKAVEGAVRERFGSVPPAPSDAPEVPVFEVPLSARPVARVITDPEVPGTGVSVSFKTRAHPVATEADQRESYTSNMAAAMLTRRLDTLSQDPSAPFTGAGVSVAPDVFGCLHLVGAAARAKEGKVQQSLETLLVELERARRFGFEDTEIQRIKQQVARGLDSIVESEATAEPENVAKSLASSFVSGSVEVSAEYLKSFGTRLLADVTRDELNARVKAWGENAEELVVVSGPSGDAMPDAAALAATISSAEQKPLEPYRDAVTREPLLATLPTPGSVIQEEQVPEVGLSVWTLSNGARVVLRPTDFKKDEIIGRGLSFGGNGLVSDADFASARFATDVVAASGVGTLDLAMLRKVLAGKLVGARPWLAESDEGISYSASPRDIETMFQLIYAYITAPRRDEQAFEAFRAALREGLRNRDLSPDTLFGDSIARAVWGNHPRRLPPTLADVDAIQLDRALAIYRDRFSDVSDVSFVFVGDIDVATLRPLVERYLASLPGAEPGQKPRREKFKNLGLHRKKGVTRVRVHEGREDKASVTLTYHGESPWSDPAHTDLVSLQSFLEIRLREVLRDQMGDVYGVNVSSGFDRVPFDAWSLGISFTCKPADIDKLMTAIHGVLADVSKNGVAPTYIEKLVSQRTRDLELEYRSNGFWLNRLADTYERGDDPRQILILHELTRRVTSDNIRLAARKYLRDDQYIDAQLLPKTGPAAPTAPNPPTPTSPTATPPPSAPQPAP
jgi:zinc protease